MAHDGVAWLVCVGCGGGDDWLPLPASEPIEADGGAGFVAELDWLYCHPPEGPFGVEIGRVFEPLTLTACDGSDYDFYGEDFCRARFTVLTLAAGWCAPSLRLSRWLTREISEPYGPRGVRVIQVITQTEEYGPPDEAYCAGWVETHGLTNIELIDPAQMTGIYFPGNALPSTLILDDEGVIRFRLDGNYPEELTAALDAILAEEGGG